MLVIFDEGLRGLERNGLMDQVPASSPGMDRPENPDANPKKVGKNSGISQERRGGFKDDCFGRRNLQRFAS